MGIWGIAMWAAFGVLCYLLGRLHNSTTPHPSEPIPEASRVMTPVERPTAEEKTLAERQFDEIVGGDPWRDTP